MKRYWPALLFGMLFIRCKQSPDKEVSGPQDSTPRSAGQAVPAKKTYDYCYSNREGIRVLKAGESAGLRINLAGDAARLSPDGTCLAYTYEVAPEYDRKIGLLDLTTLKTSFPDTACHNCYGPVWSPDGKYLAYNAMQGEQWNVKLLELGTGKTGFIPLDSGKFGNFSPQWTADSKKLIVQDMTNVYLVDLNGKTVRTININSMDSAVGVGSSATFVLNEKEDKLVCDCEVSTDITELTGGPPPHLMAYDFHTKKLTGLQPKGIICFDPVMKGDTVFCTGYRVTGKRHPDMNIYRVDLTGDHFTLAFKDGQNFSCRTR